MKTLTQLQTEFGNRLCTLNTGSAGIRAGVKCQVKDVAGDAPIMDFVGSDNTVDRYNEVIDQAGWELANFRASPVIPDCHDYSSIAKILGRALSVDVRDGQLVNRVEFCVDNPMGLLAWKMAKGGFIKSQSVGFIPLEWVRGVNADQPDRTYTKQELLEISLVVVPANPGATVGLALKSGAINRQDLSAAAEFLRSLAAGQSGTDISGEEKQNPDDLAGASVAGIYDARLLECARSLRRVLAK
jgi:HK97 family phage prohead protease